MSTTRFKSVPDASHGSKRLKATATNQPVADRVSLGMAYGTTGLSGTAVLTAADVTAALIASEVTGPVGPGGTPFTVTVQDTFGNPLSGVSVWVTSDLAGTTTIAGTLTTDPLGKARFMLPTGTAYVWRMSPTYTFPNPQAITVT